MFVFCCLFVCCFLKCYFLCVFFFVFVLSLFGVCLLMFICLVFVLFFCLFVFLFFGGGGLGWGVFVWFFYLFYFYLFIINFYFICILFVSCFIHLADVPPISLLLIFVYTFYLRLYGVGHMIYDHSHRKRGNPLPPHGLLFPINSKGPFICIIPQTGYHIPRPLLRQSWSTGWNETT